MDGSSRVLAALNGGLNLTRQMDLAPQKTKGLADHKFLLLELPRKLAKFLAFGDILLTPDLRF